MASASLLIQHGFWIPSHWEGIFNWLNTALAGAGAMAWGWLLIRTPHRRQFARHYSLELLLVAGLLICLMLFFVLPHDLLGTWASLFHQKVSGFFFGVIKIFLLINVLIQVLRAFESILGLRVRVEILLAGSFLTLILAGTLLLLLPKANGDLQNPITSMDAFFTATSAACVTGLVTRDTGSEFSTLGQMLITSIFQVGGLGIVTFVAFISSVSSRTLPVPQMVAFRQLINAPAIGDLKRRFFGIVLLIAAFEAVGALLLFFLGPQTGDFLERSKWAIFHSVSAFCNAGFALQPDSLEYAKNYVGVNLVIMTLIVAGGLGFLVLPEIFAVCWRGCGQLWPSIRERRGRFGFTRPRFSVQARLSLFVTGFLIIAGTVGFFLLEASNVLEGQSWSEALLTSGFQSITTRTAGFNTVPIGELQTATLLFMIILMAIGGCPVSTAGGIKTVTFGILALALRATIFQREAIEIFGRRIAARVVFMALNIFGLYVTAAISGVFFLALFEPAMLLRDLMFEAISALSTVGLSTGITASLSDGSKITLCVLMFLGRIGPIAIVLSIFQSNPGTDYEFPREDVVVG